MALLTVALSVPCLGQGGRPDWQTQVRERVAAREIGAALEIVERRLSEDPQDLEARGWRARLLAWSGRWGEAEAEYRRVLEAYPKDTDILLGLADVLAWQKRYTEALVLLDRAQQQDPGRADLHTRRGRVLGWLERIEEAREAFRQALRLDPTNAEAQAGLDSLEPEPRNEFRLAVDTDVFSFAENAHSLTASLRSRLSSRWTSGLAGNFQRRFGEDTGSFLASATYRWTADDSLSAGGGAGRDQGVIAKGQAFFEYGHGVRLGSASRVRGIELGYRQQWLWFRAARILVLTPNVVFYFPRDWLWTCSVSPARSRFPGQPAEWSTSGLTRLSFPLRPRVRGHLFFAVGTENFAQADQIGRFSARSWGGGMRWQFARRQDLDGYFFFQDRSQGRTQTGFGFSYGIRF